VGTGTPLALILDRDAVARAAGPVYLERGLHYLADGRVGPISETDDAIEATVRGGQPYHVRVAVVDASIQADCSCPMGDAGVFCKHCVALSLAWIDERGQQVMESAGRPRAKPSADPVPSFLAGLDRDGLIALIRDEMARDDALATRLRLRAAVAAPGGEGLSALKRDLDRATDVRRFLRYRDVPDFASGVHEVADAIDALLRDGHAETVIELSERALGRLEEALADADDSDGLIGDPIRSRSRNDCSAGSWRTSGVSSMGSSSGMLTCWVRPAWPPIDALRRSNGLASRPVDRATMPTRSIPRVASP